VPPVGRHRQLGAVELLSPRRLTATRRPPSASYRSSWLCWYPRMLW
jgi:hypothetical protein